MNADGRRCAVCGMRHVVDGMRYVVCGMRYVVEGMRYAGSCLLSTAYRLLPTAYRLPPTAYRILPTAYRLLPTASCLPLALAVGCAGLNVANPPENSLTEKREQRAEEATGQFEAKRDFAEFQAVLARWNHQDVKGCREGLRRLLTRSPNHREARLLMADVCLSENKRDEAFYHVEQALDTNPEDARVQYTMGLLLDTMGRSTEALAYYQRAVEGKPDDELYAVAYHNALQTAGPDPTTLRFVEADHTPGVQGSLRAVSHSEPPQRASGADPIVGVDRAGIAEAGPIGDLVERGHAALAEGSFEEALVYFREAAASPHNPKILISAATASLRHNQPDLALDLLEPVRKRFSDSAPLHRVLGVAYYRRGDYKSSQAALAQALSLDKSCGLSYFLMGCTLVKLGQSESAEAHFRQARTIDPRYAARR